MTDSKSDDNWIAPARELVRISKENIDFKQLVETLRSSFTEVIKTAESNGAFEFSECFFKF